MVLCACAGAVLATCLWIVLGAVLASRDAVGPDIPVWSRAEYEARMEARLLTLAETEEQREAS
jgi:hypothetical protein